jgi:Transposase DDE domain
LFALRGAQLRPDAAQAAGLLATVIAEGAAPDRVISLVDPQARHGHKTTAHGFDGYKGHIASDPDSEIITAAEVGPANGGDAAMAEALLAQAAPGSKILPGGRATARPAQGGAQAGAPAAPPPRWAARSRARAAARRPGLQAAGCRGQPRPPRHPRIGYRSSGWAVAPA